MTMLVKQIALLAAKDLRIEARTRATIGLVMTLGVLIIVVLGLGLGIVTGQQTAASTAPAILWVAYLFGGVLCFEKTMSVERHDGAMAALLLAPIDRSVIYAGKLISNMVLMIALALVVTPVAIVFFRFDLSVAPGSFAIIMLLSMFGFAALGTLFAAVVSSSSIQGGLLAMAVFPLCLPLVIVSTVTLEKVFTKHEPLDFIAMAFLVGFALIHLVVSWLVFELVLEP